MKRVFYIDPMSYNNMAVYDYNLLNSNVAYRENKFDILYFGSYLYQKGKIQSVNFIPIFKYNKIDIAIFKLFSYIFSLLKILYYCYKYSPEIVHIQWIKCFWIDYLFLKLLLFKKVRVVYTAHNILPHNDVDEKQFYNYRRYYKNVSHIIVHTISSQFDLIDKFNIDCDKISVINHGLLNLPCDEKHVNNLIEILRDKYGLAGKYVFSSIGYQSIYKGTDWLIRLWTEMDTLKNNSQFILLLAGKFDGSIDYGNLKDFKNVIIVDRFLDDDEYVAYLRLSSVMMLPYKSISQSGVLLSAMYENKPVLVSQAGGLTDPFTIGKIGWNMGLPSYDNLYNTMLYILENLNEINQIKNNHLLWSKIENFYSWDAISMKTYNLYQKYM